MASSFGEQGGGNGVCAERRLPASVGVDRSLGHPGQATAATDHTRCRSCPNPSATLALCAAGIHCNTVPGRLTRRRARVRRRVSAVLHPGHAHLACTAERLTLACCRRRVATASASARSRRAQRACYTRAPSSLCPVLACYTRARTRAHGAAPHSHGALAPPYSSLGATGAGSTASRSGAPR